MKIIDQLNKDEYSISFEVFPPKKELSLESYKATTEEIAKLKPAFMSVTYGAGGGTSAFTLDIAKNIHDKFEDVPMLAHLTCVSSDKETIHQRIAELKEAGIENIMALRGDLTPQLEQTDRSKWDYQYAIELVREIKEAGDFCIGGACYPETHYESPTQRADIQHIKEKVDAGVDFLTTQMFFDNNLFFSYLYKLRESGVTCPVIPGIMPITNANQVERAIKLSGAFMPQRFRSLVDRFGNDPDAMKQAGIIYATDQIIDLYANGIKCVHVYTMNKPDVAEAIYRNVSAIIGHPIGE